MEGVAVREDLAAADCHSTLSVVEAVDRTLVVDQVVEEEDVDQEGLK